MNERIRELAEQAWKYANETVGYREFGYHDAFEQKFAELIVRECIDIAYEYDEPKLSGPGMIIGNRIEQHFGVEE